MLDKKGVDKDASGAGSGERRPSAWERILTAALILTLAVAALAYAPSVPYPASLQRHAAALAGVIVCALVAARALAGRGFPLTPLPAATLGIAAALAFTAFVPIDYSFRYSSSLATATAASAAGLCVLAAGAQGVSSAGFGRRLLWGAAILGAAVSSITIAEAAGLDPLGAAPFYDSRRNPVATLGNTNPLVNFLTPCATLACALALGSRGKQRAAAFACAAACAAATGLAGVLYGLVALTVGLTAAGVLSISRNRQENDERLTGSGFPWLAPAALVLLGLSAHWLHAQTPDPAPATSSPTAAAQVRSTAGWPVPETLEVRARIWLASLRLGLDFAPWGAGAGNFAVAFPPKRDPAEIELSTHHRLDTAESVVDHAHNDSIQLAVEGGIPALVALGALAVGLWRWRKRGLYTATAESAAATAGLTAVFVTAFAHAPLYETAASAVLTAILFGVVGSGGMVATSGGRGNAPAILGRPLGILLLCALPLPALLAYRLLRADILLTQERTEPSQDLDRLREAAELAPDDVHSVLDMGRRLRAAGDRDGALVAFSEAKRRQPFLVEPIMNVGVLLAEKGEFAAALDAFQVCERLDPGHPSLRTNRTRLLLHRAEVERDARRDREAADFLSQAIQHGSPEILLREWGNSFYELKQYGRAIPYLDHYASRQPLDAENWHRMGMAFQKIGNLQAASLDFARAHHLFALEHVRANNLDAASRSAKQYLRWAEPNDAGPSVLEAMIALRRDDSAGALAALVKSDEGKLTLDPRTLDMPEYSILVKDPALGPRARKLVK